mmetsp:Transcript_11616/g.29475  ORF Transcript_11616/g.29475 Transcript_11616/m.29475 type:complete len:341 (-) Transcript_11616:117-1139(-)
MAGPTRRAGHGDGVAGAAKDAATATAAAVLAAAQGDADGAKAAAHVAATDAARGLEEWQRKWYAHVYRKTLVWVALFLALVGYAVTEVEDPHVPPFDPSEAWRVWLTLCGALLAWSTLFFDIYFGTPPAKGDPKEILMGKNFNGKFSYFTFYIIFSFTVYWTSCLVAEVAWLWGYAHYQEVVWARKLLKFTYAGAPLISALGVMLTLLFLKFNWFEPSWQREVLGRYHQRGQVWFGPTMLFTHLNQTPISLLDVAFIKNRKFAEAHRPEFIVFAAILVAFTVFFVVSTHLNFSLTKHYPYPIFSKFLGTTWKAELTFIGTQTLVTILMTAAMVWVSRIQV